MGCFRRVWSRAAERLGAKLHAVSALQPGDEFIGATGGVVQSGHAQRGGFAAGERGEAVLPIRGILPAAVELFSVEPGRTWLQAEMRAGGGPTEVFHAIDNAGADRVQFHVAKRGLPMGIVEDAGVEAALPEFSGAAFEGVAISGVAAVDVHHEERDGVGLVAHRDQVEVIGHQSISGDADGALLAMGFRGVAGSIGDQRRWRKCAVGCCRAG